MMLAAVVLGVFSAAALIGYGVTIKSRNAARLTTGKEDFMATLQTQAGSRGEGEAG
jgi:hypothetical protein